MKPFKTLFMLLTAVILLTATSACEEEWSNLSDDQKLIELLLQPTPGAEKYRLDPDYRFVILKTGLDPDSISNDQYLQAQTEFRITEWTRVNDSVFMPTDTVGFIQDVNTLRQTLTVSADRKVWLNDYEIIGIQDVYTHDLAHPHFHIIHNFVHVYLSSQEEIPGLIRFVESIGCRVTEAPQYYNYFSEYYVVKVTLPLGWKAIPTCDYIESNYKVKSCSPVDTPVVCPL